MFYFACMVSLFFLLFFMKKSPYTFLSIVFFLVLLICSKKYFTTYDMRWNVSFVLFFLCTLFTFRAIRPKMRFWNLPLIVILSGAYVGIEWLHATYAELIRIDLSLLISLCLFFLAWLFTRELWAAFCLSVCSLFFSTILFGWFQLYVGKMTDFDIGTITHLNEIGWMTMALIFFSLCERIRMIEKNYG